MFTDDYEGDALSINDAQVSSDWRFGLLRQLAQIVQRSAVVESQTLPVYGFDYIAPGSDEAHLARKECSIVEVYKVQETTGIEYIRDYDSSYPESYQKLTALATCKCGRFVKQPVHVRVDGLVERVTR